MAWENYIEKILPQGKEPEPKDKIDLMNRLNYVGNDPLSQTQMKKLRREAADAFINNASRRPNWQHRIEELWDKNGDKRFKLN